MARVAVFTLGCKVNQAESEELKLALGIAGHEIVGEAANADLCVINTCTVTAESDRKCRKLARRLWREGARAIVAAGCYVEVNPGCFEGLPGIVALIPNSRKGDWIEQIMYMLPPSGMHSGVVVTGRARGFVKVQDGCERGCSYCIVPRARGPEVSIPSHVVMEAATRWREQGCDEVVLCGVNLGRYRQGDDYDLSTLVDEMLRCGEGFRLRLSSIELEDLRVEWLRKWSSTPRVCPHLHLPLQSGDESLLRDMGRGYTPAEFIGAVEELRRQWPRAALTTEVMVGYPGETDDAFDNTVRVLERIRPARVHVFRFSPRPGTRAWGRADVVSADSAERRSAVLRALAEKWRMAYIHEHLGESRGFLVERITRGGNGSIAWGTTEDYVKGALREPPPGTRTGKIIPVEISGLWRGVAVVKPLSSPLDE